VGAVIGVAVLGSIVNGRLHTDLIARLNQLKVPHEFYNIIIQGVETGTVPSNGGNSALAPKGQEALVQKVYQAAYSAFQSGLHVALYLSAVLMAGVAILALVTLHGRPGDITDDLAPAQPTS
jgi:hypothetical protein